MPEAFLDFHFHIIEPEKWLDDYAKIKPNQITFYYDSIPGIIFLI